MKFNKWTLGLAAIGAVSLVSAAKADEKMSAVQTAVSSTTISGYVSTSAHWNPGTGNGTVPGYAFNTPGKADGFNLDVISVSISKPLDEAEWASGYKAEFIYGPDANFFGTSPIGGLAGTDFAIKQAYVNLRTPVGNGIDWKVGVFDTIVSYESFDAGSNPNYTRSYGYTIQPTTHTGILGTYRICDEISVALGIANTTGPVIGGGNVGGTLFPVSVGRANPYKAESYKAYMGSVALTAPADWGVLSGSTFYAGFVNGFGGGPTATTGVQTSFYIGATIATPVEGLRLGVAYDYLNSSQQTLNGGFVTTPTWAEAVSLYASYQITEKLSVHARGEYFWQRGANPFLSGQPSEVIALTGTLQYDLWQNVISRLEIRWDHDADGSPNTYGAGLSPVPPIAGTPANGGIAAAGGHLKKNSVLVAANIIYKF